MDSVGSVIAANPYISIMSQIKNAQRENPALQAAYQLSISEEAFQKFKGENPEQMLQIAENVKAHQMENTPVLTAKPLEAAKGFRLSSQPWICTPTDEIHSDGQHTYQGVTAIPENIWRENFIQNNLSPNAQKLLQSLQDSTSAKILCDRADYSILYGSYRTSCAIGASLLEFMAENLQHQDIWENIAQGNFGNLADVDRALRSAGDDTSANRLRTLVRGNPPSQAELRQTLAATMLSDMTSSIQIGSFEMDEKEAYVNSILSDDVLQSYTDFLQKQREENTEKFYQQEFQDYRFPPGLYVDTIKKQA